MEQKLGWKVIQAAFQCGRELQVLLRFEKRMARPMSIDSMRRELRRQLMPSTFS